MAQQATQVYYLSYACQRDPLLQGWDIVHKVSPHGKAPTPNAEDYNFDTSTYDGEFYQVEGLEGTFEIDLTGAMEMEVDNEIHVDEDDGDVVENAKDLELLEQLSSGNGSGDIVASLESVEHLDLADSDDESYDPDNPDGDDYF